MTESFVIICFCSSILTRARVSLLVFIAVNSILLPFGAHKREIYDASVWNSKSIWFLLLPDCYIDSTMLHFLTASICDSFQLIRKWMKQQNGKKKEKQNKQQSYQNIATLFALLETFHLNGLHHQSKCSATDCKSNRNNNNWILGLV